MGLFNKKVTTTVTDASIKSESSLTVCLGATQGMIIFHMVQMFEKINKQAAILVIDNSLAQDLYDSVPHENNIGMIGNASLLSMRCLDQNIFQKFDFIFAYFDTAIEADYLQAADHIIVMHDYTPACTGRLRAIEWPDGVSPIPVFLNKVSSRIQENKILDAEELPGVEKDTVFYIFPLTETDANAYLSFLYDGDRSFSSMSPEYKEAIGGIVSNIINTNNIDMKKIIKSM